MPTLTSTMQRRIGAQLRVGYAELTGDPLPDEQVELLLRLRQKERGRRRLDP